MSACESLLAAKHRLSDDVDIIITRGFEEPSSLLGKARKLSRLVGRILFSVIYPHRRSEIEQIFQANGHDVDGCHLDVAIAHNGKILKLLPLGVFTPLWWQKALFYRHAASVEEVWKALRSEGFSIHGNFTESLQVHCDFQR